MDNKDVASIHNVNFKKDQFIISWQLTSLCNYNCKFCIQGDKEKHKKDSLGESAKKRKIICDKIVSFIENLHGYKKLKIHLLGGEITILKDFPEILTALASCHFKGEIRFNITTNFSAPADYYIKLFDTVKKYNSIETPRSLAVSVSFYKDYVEFKQFCKKLNIVQKHLETNVFTLILNNLAKMLHLSKVLKKNDLSEIFVSYPILCDTDYDNFIKMKKCFKNKININPIIIREYKTELSKNISDLLISNESKKKNILVKSCSGQELYLRNIQALGLILEDKDKFYPKGYICDAGVHSIRIDNQGNVKRCASISNEFMCNLECENLKCYTEPQICNSDHCSCNMYGLIEKVNQLQ